MAVHAPQRHDSEEVSCDEAGTDDQTIPAPAGYGLYRQLDFELHPRRRSYPRIRRCREHRIRQLSLPRHGAAGRGLSGRTDPLARVCRGRHPRGIMAYEDTMFFEILAQELALRDMDSDAPTPENVDELRERMDTYLGEFEQHGTDNILVDSDTLP